MPIDQSNGTPTPPPPPPGANAIANPMAGERAGKARGANNPIDLRVDKPHARVAEVGWLLVAGFLYNLVAREFAFASLLGVIPFVIVAFLIGRRTTNAGGTFTVLAAAGAILPWLVLRTDPGMVFANLVTILALIALAAGYTVRGSVFDASVGRMLGHLISQMSEWIFGLTMISRLVKKLNQTSASGSVFRGAALAVPVIVVFAALLASADKVFARFLLLNNLPNAVGHVALTIILSIGFLGLVSRAAHETPPGAVTPRPRLLGRTEVVMVLGAVVVLFVAFTITQVVVALGGAATILETEGLTQAGHARAGFFQLMWVSVLAAVLVGLVRWSHADRTEHDDHNHERDIFTPLALLTLMLTIAIAGVSLSRFAFYIGSFGLSLDRIWAMAIVVGVILLTATYMVSILGWRKNRSWYPGTAVLIVAGLVFALNVLNPASVVASYNMANTPTQLDTYYLSNLSDDAVPAIISNLDSVTVVQAQELISGLCTRSNRSTTYGFLEYNRSAVNADQRLDALCVDPRPERNNSIDFD